MYIAFKKIHDYKTFFLQMACIRKKADSIHSIYFFPSEQNPLLQKQVCQPLTLAFLQRVFLIQGLPISRFSPNSLPVPSNLRPASLPGVVGRLSLGAFSELEVEKDLHILVGVVMGMWVEMLQALGFFVSGRWMLQEMRCGVVYKAVRWGLCSFVVSLASFFRTVGVGRRVNRMVSTSVSRYPMWSMNLFLLLFFL